MRHKRRRPQQLSLPGRNWGGRRPGAGRKPKAKRRRVPHVRRPYLSGREPLRVTVRLRDGLPMLRRPRFYRVIRKVLLQGGDRFGLRVVHYSLQDNHLHLLVEARDRRALTRGMKGFGVRLARQLNRVLSLRGSVYADRFHARVLRTPQEIRTAISYVLNNARKHAWQRGKRLARNWIDPYSSAAQFDGWTSAIRIDLRGIEPPVGRTPQTWLLRVAWRRHGLIPGHEVPTARTVAR